LCADKEPIERSQQHPANERTFLSWLRTSIALIGLGGVSYSIANLILDRKSKSKTSKNVYANRSDSKIASDKNSASGRCFYIVSKHPFFGIS
jgi:uncharacterized membrane protein YidH (DUF202 family)